MDGGMPVRGFGKCEQRFYIPVANTCQRNPGKRRGAQRGADYVRVFSEKQAGPGLDFPLRLWFVKCSFEQRFSLAICYSKTLSQSSHCVLVAVASFGPVSDM